jgi:hypothetical protein
VARKNREAIDADLHILLTSRIRKDALTSRYPLRLKSIASLRLLKLFLVCQSGVALLIVKHGIENSILTFRIVDELPVNESIWCQRTCWNSIEEI